MLSSRHRTHALAISLVLGACTPEEVGCSPREGATPTEPSDTPLAPSAESATPARVHGDAESHGYLVSVPHPENHYLEIEASFPASGESLELMMAVWTPGSYLVREYARNVEGVSAATPAGAPLEIRKTAKNRWEVRAAEGTLPEQVIVRYRVYARELTVRTSFVDAELMALSNASVFITVVDHLDRPHDLRFELPEGWVAFGGFERAATGPQIEPGHFVAADFDALLDAPIVAARPCGEGESPADSACRLQRDTFEVDGVEYELLTLDGGAAWDQARVVEDLTNLVRTQHEFWQILPFSHYTFFNLLTGGGGGLEHKYSTMFIGDRWLMRSEEDYRRWLGLVSHEFFHAWNVKRFRPEPLGPFDYEHENYVHDLWVAEGITSYFDDLLLHRAGLMDQDAYLAALTRSIERVQQAPGRSVQSLDAASFDAWIKFYRPDENSVNTRVSYYTKGLLVAFLLDQRIRDASRGDRALDDVMRLGYQRYSGERGYTPAEFRTLCEEVAGEDLGEFFAMAVDGTAELPYERALARLGLRFAPVEARVDPDGGEPTPGTYLGVETEESHGRVVVSTVRRGTPAYAGGVNVGDELIALDGERLPGDLSGRLGRLLPGVHELLLARRGRMQTLALELSAPPQESYRLEVDPQANPLQGRALTNWLAGQ